MTLRRPRIRLREGGLLSVNKIEELLELFGKMNFVEIMGFANLLGVEEEEEFEDYLTNILAAFSELPRRDKRKIFKLAKQVISGRG